MDKKERVEHENRDDMSKIRDKETDKSKTLISNGFLNDKSIDVLLFVSGLCMGLVHIVYANYYFMSLEIYRTMHLSFALIIGTLLIMKGSSSRIVRIINLVLIAGVLFSFVYISVNVDAIRLRQWMNTDLDLIVGLLLMAMAFYTTIKHFGWILPTITFLVVIYPMFGKYMTGVFKTTNYTLEQTIVNLSIGLHGGVYNLMSVSANYIFLFSVFGGVMNGVGVVGLFSEIGKLVAGRTRSGSAQTTCVMQGLFGTVIPNGMAVAEMSGPITLPLMLKAGYKKTTAAGILAGASNGGRMLPPVMGALAFAIAGYASIPYWTIAKMALLPALLYYAGVMWYSHIEAMKSPTMRVKIKERPEIDWDIIKWKSHVFIIPFTVIVIMMAMGKTILITAWYGIALTLIVSYITKKEYRPNWRTILKKFSKGAITGAKLACVLASIGMLITTFANSGLNVKLSAAIEAFSNGNLLLVIVIIYAISIIAGMAGELVSAYLIIATFSVSILQNMGVSYELAHFFSAWPSNMAPLTPPVATLAIITSRIAGTPYGKTAFEACKAAFVGFVLPFILIYVPAITLTGSPSVWMWIDIAIVLVFLFAAQTAFGGWLMEDMSMVSRIILGAGSIVLFAYMVNRNSIVLGVGLVLILVSIIIQIRKYRQAKQPLPVAS